MRLPYDRLTYPSCEPRTYEVRTYGCQMNVHDSERIAGLLEMPAMPGPGGRQPDVVVFNTCAVRENADNRLYGNLGHLRPVKDAPPRHADRRRRLPGAEGPRRHRPSARPGSTSSSARTTSARCRCCSSGPGTTPRPQVEILESLEVFPSTLPTRRESTYAGVGVDLASAATTPARSASCRRCAARRRTAAPATSSPRSQRAGRRRRRWRSRCSGRTSTPTAWSSATGTRSASCCAPAATIDGLERVRFTSPHPKDFTDDVIAAMAETPNVCHSAAHAAAVRLATSAARDAPVVPLGALPRHHRPGPGGHAGRGDHDRHHRRLPRRDRGRLRSAPSTWSARRGSRRRFTFQYSQAPRHARRDHGRPGAQGGRAGAVRAAGRAAWRRSPGRRTRRWSAQTVEVLVAEGEGRKDARTGRMSGRARDGRLVHFAPATGRADRARATSCTPPSPTPRRTTWSPTVRRRRTGAPGPATRPRRGRSRVPRVLLGLPTIGAPAARRLPLSGGCAAH